VNTVSKPTGSIPLSTAQAAFLAFAVAAIIFFVFRIGLFPIAEHDARAAGGGPHIFDQSTGIFSAERNLKDYRPLGYYLMYEIGNLYAHYNDLYHPYVVFLASLLNGLLSLLIFGICHHQTRSTAISLAASFLYVFAGAGIVSGWLQLFGATMVPIHLAILGSIFSYLKFRTAPKPVCWYWLIPFVVLCVIGPWFRESAYLGPAVVLIVELFRLPKTRSPFIFFAALLVAHSIAPNALTSLLGLYTGPVTFMFGQATVSQYLGTVSWSQFAAGRVINEIPPLLWAVLLPVIAWSAAQTLPKVFSRTFWNNLTEAQPFINLSHDENVKSRNLPIGIIIGVTVFLLNLYLIHPIFRIDLGAPLPLFLPFLFLISLAFFTALRFGLLFPIWLLGALPPLILVNGFGPRMASVAVVPLAIICALYIGELFQLLSKIPKNKIRNLIYSFHYVALALVVMDHLGNAPSSFLALKNLNTGHRAIGNWIRHNVPKGSTIFGDFGAHTDPFFLTGGPDLTYVHRPLGAYKLLGFAPDTPQLETIQKAIEQEQDVYYLNLASYSTDYPGPLPVKAMKRLATFRINNLRFELDPLRRFIDKTRSGRSLIHGEWDNTYKWLGWGADPSIWKAEINIYQLDMSKAKTLTESSFFDLARSAVPREAGQIPQIESGKLAPEWTNISKMRTPSAYDGKDFQLSGPPPRVRLSSASKTVPYSASQIIDRDYHFVWHSESAPTYPQWIEFIFESPVEVKRIFMGRQTGGPMGVNRAPKRFTFQGKNGGEDWVDLLEVENAGFTDVDEIRTWQLLYKTPKFTTYRILIKSNNGAHDVVTINFINFEFVTDR